MRPLTRPILVAALASAALLAGAHQAWAQPGGGLAGSATVVHPRAVVALDKVAPGGQVPVAVVFDMEPGYHIQTNDPQLPPELGEGFSDFVIKTEIKPGEQRGDAAAHPDLVQWPPVHMAELGIFGTPLTFGVFEGASAAFVPVTVDTSADAGAHDLTLLLTYQACDDTVCLMPVTDQPLSVSVPVAAADSPANEVEPALFASFDPAVWQRVGLAPVAKDEVAFDLFGAGFSLDAGSSAGFALLLLVAALGGMLLNFTPCVLPLIPIKIMTLQQAAGSRRRGVLLGAVMSVGVVAFWLTLGALIAWVAGFTAANQLFQYPAFTLGVGLVIGVMAFGMMGRFAVTLPQSVYKINPVRDTVAGSFIFGIMIAVLSTPCTAPFMGAAAAWATTQAPALTLATFAAIGIGMALPYFVLSAVPELLRRLPRTGPASQVVKDVMGLLMLAAAAYFLGVGLSGMLVEPPQPPSRMYWWVVAVFVVMAGAWTTYQALKIGRGASRWVFGTAGIVAIALAVYGATTFTSTGPIDWTYYTADGFDEAVAANQIVVMDFTAEWCLNCKTLEETVLKTPEIVALLASPDVVPMKVDLTGNNDAGAAKLKDVGRVTIPLLTVFGPDGTQVFESDFYTKEQLLQAVETARRGDVAETG